MATTRCNHAVKGKAAGYTCRKVPKCTELPATLVISSELPEAGLVNTMAAMAVQQQSMQGNSVWLQTISKFHGGTSASSSDGITMHRQFTTGYNKQCPATAATAPR